MEETISDIDLKLDWGRTGQHLRVTAKWRDGVLYSSVTGQTSPLLSERQVKWITEHFQQKKKNYVFI
jgi:hypothetical protein